MERSKIIVDQIKADIHNIQVMVDMLKDAKKTHYSQIKNAIKVLVKDIRLQKESISDILNHKEIKYKLPLFEVEPSEIEQVHIDSLSSFFGNI